ncbi:UNVERIFIED_CONTAM: Photosynthetic NDH subunit of lumenal location 2, chloroplastic [Sesamum calycinum]|uniref:Photosynthetic NDH subunit of lumenal location 2, chloroplastic n=1 Tax=Sesamum calycinum TaxID=2727403 RepID=A0AAW2QX59_9LAMI
MSTITNSTSTPPFRHHITAAHHHNRHHQFFPRTQATLQDQENPSPRRKFITTFLTTSLALAGLQARPLALAQNWGTRSFLRERFFEPGLSPEDAVARIRQTAEGLHDLRGMLESMSWRYVIFYIRLKQAYLSQDMKTAMSMVPESRRKSYVQTANELVDNMAEFDYYVRTPKVYESYVYYEKTLKSIDDLVALLA